jgi:phage major head subunit gpT-like protein
MTLNLKGLGSRAVIGAFYKRLEETQAASWIPALASMYTSNQESETYTFLGDSPKLMEWGGTGTDGGNRTTESLKPYDFTIKNRKFSGGLEIDEDDFRRDKTGQILSRTNELAARAAQLPQRIISDLLNSNGTAYDTKAFYHATDHVTANGDVVNNDLSYAAAIGTLPTVQEMVDGLLTAIQGLLAFKDDAGEPRNEFATQFAVMVPVTLWSPLMGAIKNDYSLLGQSNTLRATQFAITPFMNARLTAQDKLFIFRTDSDVKPFVWQDEVPATMAVLAEGSDWHTTNDSRKFFVKRLCNGGYGRFDQTVRLTFS